MVWSEVPYRRAFAAPRLGRPAHRRAPFRPGARRDALRHRCARHLPARLCAARRAARGRRTRRSRCRPRARSRHAGRSHPAWRRRSDRVPADRGLRRPRPRARGRTLGRRRAVQHVDRLRRRAHPQGLSPPRARDQPRAGDAPLPHRARVREHRRAGRLVRVLRRAARRDTRNPPGVRAQRARRLGARAGRALDRARALRGAVAPARRGDRRDAHGACVRSERPCFRARDAERRGARPAHRDRRRGDRARLPRAARGRRAPRADRRPRRGGARAASDAHVRGLGGKGDSDARRLPPRADALVGWGLGDPRLRGRAGPVAHGPAAEAFAVARRRRNAAVVRVCRECGRPSARPSTTLRTGAECAASRYRPPARRRA